MKCRWEIKFSDDAKTKRREIEIRVYAVQLGGNWKKECTVAAEKTSNYA